MPHLASTTTAGEEYEEEDGVEAAPMSEDEN